MMPSPNNLTDQQCSLLSLRAGEELPGSASQARVWFLLEYNGAWGEKAFEESTIQPEVKAWLSAQLAAIPGSRLLLIKSRPGLVARGVSFFIAVVDESTPRLYEFLFDSYEGLLTLDLQAVEAGGPAYDGARRLEPLFLVCTNGRRDLCCAKFGTPVYIEMLNQAGEAAWQSSHVGGHRFAPNIICFPHGLFYGRVTPGEVKGLLDSYRQGQVSLEKLRGRACYSEVVQAAEFHLRRRTGLLGVEAFRLLQADEISPALWEVHFGSTRGDRTHRLRIAVDTTNEQIYQGCSFEKTAPLVRYHLVDYSLVV